MRRPTYYELLGVSRTASDDEIERAYRRCALDRHPDHRPHDARAHAEMQQLAEAAETLRNRERRMAYDRTLRKGGGGEAAPTVKCNWLAGDVIYPITISPAEAGAGVRRLAQFHTAAGVPYTITIDLPPGTLHGTQIVVPGAGGPAREGGGRGNLIVLVLVAVPDAWRE